MRLDSNTYKGTFQPSNIGNVLHFKFCSFNLFGQSTEDLSAVTDYTYTPVGTSAAAATSPQGASSASVAGPAAGGAIISLNATISGTPIVQVIGKTGGGSGASPGTAYQVSLEMGGTVVDTMTIIADASGQLSSGSCFYMASGLSVGLHAFSLVAVSAMTGITLTGVSMNVTAFAQ